jgi:hypothetical protein
MSTFLSQFSLPRSCRPLVLIGAVLAFASACKDLTSSPASLPNFTDTSTVFAINGSPAGAPTAVKLFNGAVLRADQGFEFDLAFDIDADGNAVLIPSRALATPFSTPYSVGIQVIPGTFEALTDAPKDGYKVDSTVAVAKGTVVAIESHDSLLCLYAVKGQSYFSKLVVTDIDLALRKMSVILTINRNCGFRSFASGIPKS